MVKSVAVETPAREVLTVSTIPLVFNLVSTAKSDLVAFVDPERGFDATMSLSCLLDDFGHLVQDHPDTYPPRLLVYNPNGQDLARMQTMGLVSSWRR